MKMKVFLDTNILKFSIVSLTRLVPHEQKLLLNGKEIRPTVYSIINICPHDKIKNKELKDEIKLLSEVANLAKEEKIGLFTHFETVFELCGLPKILGREKTFFDGIQIKKVDGPLQYSRRLTCFNEQPKDFQFEFLKRIDDKRFKELQKATGAYQGSNSFNRNQLLDAFHIWCAEASNCNFYLTLDFKLIKHLNRQTQYTIKTQVLRPSELLKVFNREL